jgi:tetratricopeptide (TPR) repeat protein
VNRATTTFQLAQLYHQHLKDFKEAKKLYTEALTLHSEVLGEDHYTIGKILERLALLEVDEGSLKDAKEHYSRARLILEKSMGSGKILC